MISHIFFVKARCFFENARPSFTYIFFVCERGKCLLENARSSSKLFFRSSLP